MEKGGRSGTGHGQDAAAGQASAPARPRLWRPEDIAFCGDTLAVEVVESVPGVVGTLLADVRAARSLASMASGLWFSVDALHALEAPGARADFRARLADAGISLTTLDAVAYGELRARPVKEGVFVPDWADERRLRYTLAAARVLAECLPPDAAEGTITTSPLGWRAIWSGEKENRAAGHLLEAARALDALAAGTGRLVRLCLEPEPGAVLERTDQTIAFFRGWLLPAADALGVAREIVDRHLGICFDVCHQAVMFEDAGEALARLHEAGVPVGKIQLAAALEARDAASKTPLAAYAEPLYLHQVRLCQGDALLGAPDLDQALKRADLPREAAWRIRLHVPLARARLADGLAGTQAQALRALDFLAAHAHSYPQLEVETDTWRALPENERPRSGVALASAVAAQMTWVEGEMRRRDLMA